MNTHQLSLDLSLPSNNKKPRTSKEIDYSLHFCPDYDQIDFSKLSQKLIGDRKVSSRFCNALVEFLLEAYGVKRSGFNPDIKCFVNAQSNSFQSEPNNMCGAIQLSPGRTGRKKEKKVTITKVPDCKFIKFSQSDLLYDSCAFTDVLTQSRITPELALERQLSTLSKLPSFHEIWIASYDLLIDEKHINGNRVKQRWTVKEGELAIKETVTAAKYLDRQRHKLNKYQPIMSCQGVDAIQYQRCVEQVLSYCHPNDILGLGGWCILGRQKSYLPVFREAIKKSLPLIADAGLNRVHIFGTTWYKPIKNFQPPLVFLLHECSKFGIELSTDGTSPIGNALWKNWKKAGATFPYWRHNLAWVKAELATLKDSDFYCSQFLPKKYYQLSLLSGAIA